MKQFIGRFIIEENPLIKRIPDPKACGRKYLIIASDSWFGCDIIIIGIKDIKFSSNPAHIINQLLLEIVINVPTIRVDKNKNSIGKEEIIK